MNIGYIKNMQAPNDKSIYKRLNISKLYTDRPGEHTNLREMLKYVRQGDNIVVEDIQHLSKSIGEFTEFAITLKQQGITCNLQTSADRYININLGRDFKAIRGVYQKISRATISR